MKIEIVKKQEIEIVKKQEIAKNILPLFSQTYNKGHTLFEFNVHTKEIAKAMYSENYWNPIEKVGTRKIIIKPNCIYRQFLNITNAKKWALKTL